MSRVPWQYGLPCDNWEVHSEGDILAERKEWQNALDKEKARADRWERKARGWSKAKAELIVTQKQRNSAIERAEKAEAKLKEVCSWNENNKPAYPIVDMVGEVKHMRYTALRGILRDAE